jgi:hypothetical protein
VEAMGGLCRNHNKASANLHKFQHTANTLRPPGDAIGISNAT